MDKYKGKSRILLITRIIWICSIMDKKNIQNGMRFSGGLNNFCLLLQIRFIGNLINTDNSDITLSKQEKVKFYY